MMMLPATTTSLPNFFTPSRLLTLSRPFLTLPCPFLCAICWRLLVNGYWLSGRKSIRLLFSFGFLRFRRFAAKADAGDLDAGQLAAVADRPVVTLSAAILER